MFGVERVEEREGKHKGVGDVGRGGIVRGCGFVVAEDNGRVGRGEADGGGGFGEGVDVRGQWVQF